MTVLRDFYSVVCNTDTENEWIFLLNDRYFEETENVKILILPEIKKSWIKRLLFDFVTGKKYIQDLAPDVVLSMQNIITFGLNIPQAVYIHQSIPFQSTYHFSFLKKSERKLAVVQYLIGGIIKLSARKSDYIIVQTKWMKDAVCKLCHQLDNKVLTCLPTVKCEPENTEETELFEPTSFFYPTSSAIYKNNACIFAASAILEAKGISHKVTLTLSSERNTDSVICTGRLPHNEVMKRYRSSTLVFPSYIETFGYPLAEARQAGTIVLAADTPFSREVLDGYENAYFFDPFKPEELAALMEAVASGAITRNTISSVLENAEKTWTAVISAVYKLNGNKDIK